MIKIYCSGPIQLLTDHSMGHSDVLHLERYVMTFLANGNKPTTKKKLTIHESHPASPLYMRYNLRKVGDREGCSGGMGRPHGDRVGVGCGDTIQRPVSAIERPGLAQRLTPR